jgi:hypothetical protein
MILILQITKNLDVLAKLLQQLIDGKYEQITKMNYAYKLQLYITAKLR